MTKQSKLHTKVGDLVYAAEHIVAMRSADIPLGAPGDSSYLIPQGTAGLFMGKVNGEPDLVVVEFEHGSAMVRVEVEPQDLTT